MEQGESPCNKCLLVDSMLSGTACLLSAPPQIPGVPGQPYPSILKRPCLVSSGSPEHPWSPSEVTEHLASPPFG